MKFEDFLHSTRKTWNDKEDYSANISHALLGLTDEVGELAKQYKSTVVDDTELDTTNVIEELGDFLYFFTRVIDTLGFQKLDEVCSNMDTIIEGDVQEIKGLEAISVVLSLSYHSGNLYAAIASENNETMGKSMQETMSTVKFLAFLLGTTVGDIMDANARKLQARYKDGYTKDESANRDVEEERKAIEKDEGVPGSK